MKTVCTAQRWDTMNILQRVLAIKFCISLTWTSSRQVFLWTGCLIQLDHLLGNSTLTSDSWDSSTSNQCGLVKPAPKTCYVTQGSLLLVVQQLVFYTSSAPRLVFGLVAFQTCGDTLALWMQSLWSLLNSTLSIKLWKGMAFWNGRCHRRWLKKWSSLL